MATKADFQKAEQEESLKALRAILEPGSEVYTLVRSVSSSGMSRRISLFVVRGGKIEDITWKVTKAFGDPIKQHGKYVQDAGLYVSGCGMDMCFHTVYTLGRVLFPDGFGASPQTPDGNGKQPLNRPKTQEEAADMVVRGWKFYGRNGDGSGWDNDGGYALKYLGL